MCAVVPYGQCANCDDRWQGRLNSNAVNKQAKSHTSTKSSSRNQQGRIYYSFLIGYIHRLVDGHEIKAQIPSKKYIRSCKDHVAFLAYGDKTRILKFLSCNFILKKSKSFDLCIEISNNELKNNFNHFNLYFYCAIS